MATTLNIHTEHIEVPNPDDPLFAPPTFEGLACDAARSLAPGTYSATRDGTVQGFNLRLPAVLTVADDGTVTLTTGRV